MSFGKSKSKQSGTQSQSGTSTTTVDPWAKSQFENQTKGILDTTTAYTQSPFEKYTGQSVAGLSPDQIKARELASGSVGNWQGILGDAEAAAKSGLGYDASDPSKYYNRFESDVIDATGAYYDEQLARQINQQNDAVAMRGAFGNSSRDLGEAEIRRGGALDKAKAMADLKYAGYKDAVDTGFRDAANQYQGAGILGGLAGQKQQLGQNDVAMLESLGATSREIEQLTLDAARAEFDREAADRVNKLLLELQTRQGILGSTPMGQTTTSSGTGTSSGTTSSSQFSFAPKFSFGPLEFGA